MKKKDILDVRGKAEKEIANSLKEKKLELAKTKVKIASGEEKNIKKAKNLRREIAQLLTILKEKALMEKETQKETK